jgi:hypothetical protein
MDYHAEAIAVPEDGGHVEGQGGVKHSLQSPLPIQTCRPRRRWNCLTWNPSGPTMTPHPLKLPEHTLALAGEYP